MEDAKDNQTIGQLKHVTLREMMQAGVGNGSRLELILFKGAEYYNGYTPAPTVNMVGYDPSDNMKDAPGLKTMGYVHSMDNGRGRVVLSATQNQQNNQKINYDIATWYVDEKCIHSFKQIRPQLDY